MVLRNAPIWNVIRIVTIIYEDTEARNLLTNKFPLSHSITTSTQFIEWMNQMDEDGNSWLADVIKLILDVLLQSKC